MILNSGVQPFVAFQEFFENPRIVPTNWKKKINNQKRIVQALPTFKRVL
jgi:hypothetical protein